MCSIQVRLRAGVVNFIYPQHELVAALAERFVAGGGEIRFGVRALKVEQVADGATVSAVVDGSGERVQIRCRFVAGCDGARSELHEGIENASVIELTHPFRWLTLIAGAAPSKRRALYGFHSRGFAGQMQRGPALTLHVSGGPRDTIAAWPDDRIWAELQQRLYADGEPELAQGPFVERDVLDLRVRVIEPMHHRRLYLAGDAAHLITPAGGKGMNLAILDALELGLALRERYVEDRRGNVWLNTRTDASRRSGGRRSSQTGCSRCFTQASAGQPSPARIGARTSRAVRLPTQAARLRNLSATRAESLVRLRLRRRGSVTPHQLPTRRRVLERVVGELIRAAREGRIRTDEDRRGGHREYPATLEAGVSPESLASCSSPRARRSGPGARPSRQRICSPRQAARTTVDAGCSLEYEWGCAHVGGLERRTAPACAGLLGGYGHHRLSRALAVAHAEAGRIQERAGRDESAGLRRRYSRGQLGPIARLSRVSSPSISGLVLRRRV